MTPGGLAACMMLSVRALAPLRRGMTVWMTYQSFVSAHKRLREVFSMPYENDSGKPSVAPLSQSLELRNVTLKHDGGKVMFTDLNFKIEVGQVIGIKGESGSGKSSLMALINGLVRPTEGEILIDGKPLTDFSLDSVQKEIALLPQHATIVSGNILENMTMFDASLNEEALRISNQLGLDGIVAGMKLGYETQLGQGMAQTMPAGIRQFITIVRALSRQPSLILFDEANIALDMRGDQRLQDYFTGLKGKVTMILVTHRPSMLALADKVYALKNGRLEPMAPQVRSFGAPPPRPPGQSAAAMVIPERPGKIEDLSEIVHRQFDKESDLSLCLVPLLRALEWDGQARALAESLPHLARTLDLSDLCSIMANLGLFPKHMTGSLAELDPRLTPCLFLPKNQPAIVLLKRLPNGNVLIYDSEQRGEREIAPTRDIGKVYVFKRKDPLLQTRANEVSWMGAMMMRFRVHLLLAFGLTVASTVLGLAPSLFVKSIYDFVLPTGDMVMGGFLMIGVVVALIVDGFLRNLKGNIMAFVAGRTEYMLGTSLFYKIINLPTAAIENASSSQQVGRIKNLQSLREFFLGPLSLLIFELPSLLVLLIAIAAINPWVLMVILLSVLAFALLGYISRNGVMGTVGVSSRIASVRWEFLNEALTDMRSIRGVGSGQSWVSRFRDISGKAVMAGFKDTQVSARTSAAAQMIGSITGLFALALSAYLSITGVISGGTMMATMMILWRVTGPMQNIFLATTALTRIISNVKQIEALMKIKGESDAGAEQTLRFNDRGAVSFARVSFRYSADADPSLLGVSFTVEPGTIMAVVGGNGSGKSTLIKLIERLYTAQAGTIRIDDVDIRQLTAADLRGKISYMPQRCELFYGTIAQNLRFVHPAATDEELNWAIDMVGFRPEIEALKEGINTRISDSKGDQLPQGFRQRLSLARAILKPAPVVLLDEPGTGLDQSGEEALVRCLEWLRGRSTVVMVTHRPSHMRVATKVLLMKGGTVLAVGPFESIKEKIMSELN
jgi:ATP-binding cassette subfamily B protein